MGVTTFGSTDSSGDVRAEVRVAWRRTWGGRLMPLVLAGTALLLVAVRLTAPAPAGAVHGEVARLQGANEIAGFAILIAALASAYRLLSPDIRAEFESLSARGASRPLVFAGGRVLVGIGGLLMATAVLGLVIEVLDLGGRYQREEALHMAVIFANAVPLLMLAMLVMCAFGRIVGLIAPVVMYSLGGDAAYQRGALADGFIAQTPLYSGEELFAWLLPRTLVDPFTGIALMDQSVALQQFPVRQGQFVWGWDLIQVSNGADVLAYAIYLIALAVLFYLVCLRRRALARSRFEPVAGWLGRRKADRDVANNRQSGDQPGV